VDTADSAACALDSLKVREYDVIVSDYQMPGKDGIQLLKEIRSTGNMIPFILFTGKGREEVAKEALNNGADFYLQKGGDPTSQFAELANMIMQAHSRKKGEQTLRISEERYRSLFENSIDAVVLTAIDGSVLSANPSACHMFGMTEGEINEIGMEGIVIKDEKWKIADQRLKRVGIPTLLQLLFSKKRIPLLQRAETSLARESIMIEKGSFGEFNPPILKYDDIQYHTPDRLR